MKNKTENFEVRLGLWEVLVGIFVLFSDREQTKLCSFYHRTRVNNEPFDTSLYKKLRCELYKEG